MQTQPSQTNDPDPSSTGDQWWRARIAQVLASPVGTANPLSGGCVGEVLAVELADGRRIVVKIDRSQMPSLAVEARSLIVLANRANLPTPRVLHAEDRLLVLERIPSAPSLTLDGEQQAAQWIAQLHCVAPEHPHAGMFGFEFDTFIGGLLQPNAWAESWIEFFAQRRLVHMARLANEAGSLPDAVRARIETVAGHLDRWLIEPSAPSLIHGDIWSGNVLATPDGQDVAAFIDPAIHFAHAEVELAFITLFSTFSEAFFRRYDEIRPMEPAFFELRRDIYNLYPLLVHVRLFGAGYLPGIEGTLRRLTT